jgi:hypothetical protein
MSKQQVIHLKSADLDRAVIHGLRRSAWETKKSRGLTERIHQNRKKSEKKNKKNFDRLEEEF